MSVEDISSYRKKKRLLECFFIAFLVFLISIESAKLTRNVNGQNAIQNIRHQGQRVIGRSRSGSHGSEIYQRALAQDANRVEDEEGVVAQPGEDSGRQAGQGEGKVRVADDFGDGPGDEHGAVGGRLDGEVRVEEEDAPDEEEARGDLHEGREERRADDS